MSFIGLFLCSFFLFRLYIKYNKVYHEGVFDEVLKIML